MDVHDETVETELWNSVNNRERVHGRPVKQMKPSYETV